MSTTELRREAKAVIDRLSGTRLKVVSEFLAFVNDRETDAATVELLSLPGFEKSFLQGMSDIKAGRTRAWR